MGEDRLRAGEQLLLPGVDLCRVDVVLTGQSVDRPVGFVGRQPASVDPTEARNETRPAMTFLAEDSLPYAFTG
jgi:hypothetical protein